MIAAATGPDTEALLSTIGWLSRRSSGPTPRGAVFLHAPSDAFQAPGGGEAQLVQTGRHLESMGLAVRPFQPWVDRLEDARLLHLFGLSREGLALAKVARARRVPVVVSPISWYEPRAIVALAPGTISAASEVGRWFLQRAFPRLPRWKRTLLTLADAVLPNSKAEARQLADLFALSPSTIHPTPNGVPSRFVGASPVEWQRAYGPGPFVLYSGRIEPRKNVLGLIRAARSVDLPLTVVGSPTPASEDYAAACRAEWDGVRWLPFLPHEGPMLASAYAAARVVALPSWFETPGLAALEGAAAGTAVVVTPYGSAREYFGDHAHYSRPDRPREVAQALSDAWRAGPPPGLASLVAERYLWSIVARRTAEVYDQITG